MIQGGLIEGTTYTNFDSTSPQAIPRNLTWAGHEFIKVARDDTLWKKAKDTVAEKGGTITITVLSRMALR